MVGVCPNRRFSVLMIQLQKAFQSRIKDARHLLGDCLPSKNLMPSVFSVGSDPIDRNRLITLDALSVLLAVIVAVSILLGSGAGFFSPKFSQVIAE